MTHPITRNTLFAYPSLDFNKIDTQLITLRRVCVVASAYFLSTSNLPVACACLISAVAFDLALHVVTQTRDEVVTLAEDLTGVRQMNHYLQALVKESSPQATRPTAVISSQPHISVTVKTAVMSLVSFAMYHACSQFDLNPVEYRFVNITSISPAEFARHTF